jgi:hypothetical protein
MDFSTPFFLSSPSDNPEKHEEAIETEESCVMTSEGEHLIQEKPKKESMHPFLLTLPRKRKYGDETGFAVTSVETPPYDILLSDDHILFFLSLNPRNENIYNTERKELEAKYSSKWIDCLFKVHISRPNSIFGHVFSPSYFDSILIEYENYVSMQAQEFPKYFWRLTFKDFDFICTMIIMILSFTCFFSPTILIKDLKHLSCPKTHYSCHL